jgi:hypothetical protein
MAKCFTMAVGDEIMLTTVTDRKTAHIEVVEITKRTWWGRPPTVTVRMSGEALEEDWA